MDTFVSIEMQRTQERVNNFVRGVYNWMVIGLLLTGCTAWLVAHNESALRFVYQMKWIFFISEIALVFFLSKNINRITALSAMLMFILYAVLNGATMSIMFIVYSMQSISSAFFICAATFGISSILGWVTKRNLVGLGNFMFMGFIGIFIASIVNIFLKNSGFMMIISYLGVIIFTGLTAYDTQKLKTMALAQPVNLNNEVLVKGTVIGALTLYLDFVLMFQYLLFIFGGSRD